MSKKHSFSFPLPWSLVFPVWKSIPFVWWSLVSCMEVETWEMKLLPCCIHFSSHPRGFNMTRSGRWSSAHLLLMYTSLSTCQESNGKLMILMSPLNSTFGVGRDISRPVYNYVIQNVCAMHHVCLMLYKVCINVCTVMYLMSWSRAVSCTYQVLWYVDAMMYTMYMSCEVPCVYCVRHIV